MNMQQDTRESRQMKSLDRAYHCNKVNKMKKCEIYCHSAISDFDKPNKVFGTYSPAAISEVGAFYWRVLAPDIIHTGWEEQSSI